MILLVNVGQENKNHKRNNEPKGLEDGEWNMGGGGQRLPMEQPLAVNAENSRAKVQNVRGDSSVTLPAARYNYGGIWAISTGGTYTHWNSN